MKDKGERRIKGGHNMLEIEGRKSPCLGTHRERRYRLEFLVRGSDLWCSISGGVAHD
jgi:hypothetical protein